MNGPRAGVIGWPVEHSKSPLIHGYWLQQLGLAGSYEKIPVAPGQLPEAMDRLRALGFAGANVTLPHKEAAYELSTKLSVRAQKIGAVNTLVFQDDTIFGDCTDGVGFIDNLTSNAQNWQASDGPALVLGAGGAARAIVWALLDAGCPEVLIANRTLARAQELGHAFGAQAIGWVQIERHLPRAFTLVNTTSLGMNGQPPLILNLGLCHAACLVTDIVYTPLETPLLEQARNCGLATVDGLGMLLHQAVPGFEAWFGKTPSVDAALRQRVLSE